MSEEATSVFREIHGRITVEWDIKKFFILTHKQGERVDSPTFLFSNAKWCIRIYPNGDVRKTSIGWISMYLIKCTAKADEHIASYSLGVKQNDGSVFKSFSSQKTIFDEKHAEWGYNKVMKRSELSSSQDAIMQDGTVKFFCTVWVLDDRMKDTASQTVSPEGLENLAQNFNDLFLNGSASDVKIKVGGQEFEVHKSVLVARSSVFASMFEHKMAESKSGIVDISDCDPETFEGFLTFLYSGRCLVCPSNAVSLYKTADKYDLMELKETCIRCMAGNPSIDAVCDVINLAVVHNETEVLKSVTVFFMDNAEKIFLTAKWRSFMEENFSMANELLIKLAQSRNKD